MIIEREININKEKQKEGKGEINVFNKKSAKKKTKQLKWVRKESWSERERFRER